MRSQVVLRLTMLDRSGWTGFSHGWGEIRHFSGVCREFGEKLDVAPTSLISLARRTFLSVFGAMSQPLAGPSSTPPLLLPSLYALLPTPSLPQLLSRLSLLAMHIERYSVREDTYAPTQLLANTTSRYLRLRTRKRRREEGVTEEFEMRYMSARMVGREYDGFDVRAIVGVEVSGGRGEVEGFIHGLGYRWVHSHTLIPRVYHAMRSR